MKEVGRVSVRVMPDTSKTNQELMARLKRIEQRAKLKLKVELDKTSLAKVESKIKSLGETIKLKIDLDSATFNAAKAKIAELADRVKVNPNVDTASAEARLKTLTRPRDVRIGANINMSSFARVGAILASLSVGTAATMAITSALGSLSAVVGGLIGPLSSFIASLSALGGILIPMPALFAGMATGIILSTLAFKDAGKVLEDLGPKFEKFQKAISGSFWSAAEKPIRSLVNNTLPLLQKESVKTSKTLGKFFGELAKQLQSNLTAKNLGVMFGNLNKSIQELTPALKPIVAAFTTLGVVGSKYLPELARWVTELSEKFNTWVQGAAASGELDKMIRNAIQGFKDLGSIIANTFTIIGSIGEAAQNAGHATLGSLAENLERIDQALKSPVWQTGMTNFFTSLKQGSDTVIGALGRLLTQFATMGTFFDSFIQNTTGAVATLMDGLTAAFANNAVQANFMNFFSDIQALATGLAPALEPALQILSAGLSAIGSLLVSLAPAVTTLLSGLAPAFQVLAQSVTAFSTVLGPVIQQVVTALMPVLTTLMSSVVPVLLQALAAILPILGPIAELIAAILVPALTLFSQIIQAMLPFIVMIVEALAGWITQLTPLVTMLMGQLVPVIMQLVQTLLPPLIQVFQAIAPVITEVIAAIGPLVQAVLPGLMAVIQALLPVVQRVFQSVANVITSVMQIIKGIIQVATGVIKGDWKQVWEGIKNIFQGVWNTLINLIVGFVASFIAIIKGALDAVVGFFSAGFNNIVNWVTNGVNSMVSLITGGMHDFSSLVSSGITTAVAFFISLPGKVASALGGLVAKLTSIGTNMMQGLVNGIKNMGGAVMDAIGGVVDGAVNWAKGLLGIHSPSRVFREIGDYVGQGLEKGISGTATQVSKSIEGVYKKLIGTAEKYEKKLSSVQARIRKGGKGAAKARADLRALQKEYGNVAPGAYRSAANLVKSQINDFEALAKAKDKVNARLDTQKKKLAEIRKEYDSVKNSVASSLSQEFNLSEAISKGTTEFGDIKKYTSGVAGRIQKFAKKLKDLAKKGVHPLLLQEIAGLGSKEGLIIANAVGNATSGQLKGLNNDFAKIQKYSQSAGQVVADAQLKNGVDSVKGMIKGIEQNLKSLEKAGEKMGDALNKGVRKKLKIHSPSRVMSEVGVFVIQGLAKGITNAQRSATRAMDGVVTGVIGAADALASVDPLSPIKGAVVPVDFTAEGTSAADAMTVMGHWINIQELIVDSPDRVQEISQELFRLMNIKDRAQGKVNKEGAVA